MSSEAKPARKALVDRVAEVAWRVIVSVMNTESATHARCENDPPTDCSLYEQIRDAVAMELRANPAPGSTPIETKETLTLPMRAAGIVAEEILGYLDLMDASGIPKSLYSISRVMDDRVWVQSSKKQRSGLLELAALALLIVAAGDEANVGKDRTDDATDD